jgi:hypothetical protein
MLSTGARQKQLQTAAAYYATNPIKIQSEFKFK